jgi:predicted transcriptional regulator
MAYEKRHRTYELSTEAIAALDQLAAWQRRSRAAVVEMAIRTEYDREARRQRQVVQPSSS